MSTLSKVFVVLVFAIALLKLGVDVTLFGQRIDWKDKFEKEVNYHYQTQQIKNAEIADLGLQVENMRTYKDILSSKINMLEVENAGKSARIAELQRQFDAVDTNFKKLIADVDVYVRQLEVQITQIQTLNQTVDEYRQKLARAGANASTAMQELQYARQEAERLSKDLASLEESHLALARNKKRLEEIIAMANAKGYDLSGMPQLKQLDGVVTASMPNNGLVIISIGKDDGVIAGTEFTVSRGSEFIAKIAVDRVDARWSTGRVLLKKDDPKAGDNVTTSTLGGVSK